MNKYSIKIENCNSIARADIELTKNTLNIKYGPNGLGKSSIAKALLANSLADGSILALKPFKYRGRDDEHQPSVEGAEDIASVLVFDDTYVSQFVFQRDEVLKNSFDIFINTDAYQVAMEEIELLFRGVKSSFEESEELSTAISDLNEVRAAFGITKTGVLSKASKGFKAFGGGNKIENIPTALLPFEDFIKSEHPSGWIAWQSKGNGFLDISDNCPYCASSLLEPAKKETAKLVAQEYDSKSVEHMNSLNVVIERLGKYFEIESRGILEVITKSKIELSPEEINFLSSLSGDVETLIIKLEGLRSISFFSLRDVERIEDEVNKLAVDLTLIPRLDSLETKSIVDPINAKLRSLIDRVGELKGKINTHKTRIQKSIVENQNNINDFLKSAGYRYKVCISPESQTYKMKLIHQDFQEHLEEGGQHLSYGEKNAFALVLFMHQVLREKPSLAVLDDPVSSFDKTKKFAILNELFRGKLSLRNSTVLMLTHDIEPAVDVIRSVKGLFQTPKPTAFFLSSKSGVVTEAQIGPDDLQTFAKICSVNVREADDVIIKCVYLRRHFEIIDDLGDAYNYLSNLLHGRADPLKRTDLGEVAMSPEEKLNAERMIKERFLDFDYNGILGFICDKSEVKKRFEASNIGYDKIQLYRIYKELHMPADKGDGIVQKFLNESFHIENEYVMQLNPHKFDNVPEYIVNECASAIASLEN